KRPGAVDRETAAGAAAVAREPGEDLPLCRGPDPLHLAQPSCLDGVAQLVRRADAELAADGNEPLRREADEAGEGDERRLDFTLELLEPGEASRLDELLQPPLDPRPDPAQLAHPTRADELGHRRTRLAHELGGPPVRAHRVVPRAGEVEEGCVA